MNVEALARSRFADGPAGALLDALPHPVLLIKPDGLIGEANTAAEQFFQASKTVLRRHPLAYFIPFGSPLLSLVVQVRERSAPVNEYRVDNGTPPNGG